MKNTSRDYLAICLFFVLSFSGKIAFAFNAVTTFLPVFASSSFIATLATLPPCAATFLLASKSFGFTASEISLVDAFGKHIQNKFGVGHVIPQVFLF